MHNFTTLHKIEFYKLVHFTALILSRLFPCAQDAQLKLGKTYNSCGLLSPGTVGCLPV